MSWWHDIWSTPASKAKEALDKTNWTTMNEKEQKVMDVLKKYCVPNKENSGIKLSTVAEEILTALGITE